MAHYSEEQSHSLATRPVGRLLWEFAAPSIVAMLATSLYNLCDSMIIGWQCGPYALAGMAITFPLMNILTAFSLLGSVGASVLTSIHMGEQARGKAQRVMDNMLAMNVGFSLLLSVAGLLWLDPLLLAFGASELTLPYARDYMQIILMGLVINHVMQGLLGQLRAIGFPRAAMRAQLASVVINLLLDVIFMIGFGWGMQGAAWATVLAQVCVMLIIIPRFGTEGSVGLRIRLGALLRPGIKYIREIISVGVAPFLSNVSGFVIVMAVNLALMKYGGDLYVGAYGITNRITQLLIMMVSGFSQGLQPIVGYNLGARQLDRVRQALWRAVVTATVIMTVGYALIATFAAELASLFSDDVRMIGACVPALRIALITFPVVGSQLIGVSFFQAIHKPKLSIAITLSRQLLCLLPLLLWLPRQIGVEGVWWSMSLADVMSVLLTWWLLYSCSRKLFADR